MPLRSAPLPRMAGHLSFMRAQTKTMDALGPGDLAVLGLPFEDTSAPHAGQSLAARALRETSVYFGWHANPQFSHPIDIDARQDIRTDGLHERLCDLGDLPAGPDEAVEARVSQSLTQIRGQGACAIVLGGTERLSEAAQGALRDCQMVQLGGRAKAASGFAIAPVVHGGGVAAAAAAAAAAGAGSAGVGAGDLHARLAAFTAWRDQSRPLFVRFDLSVFETSLSGLCDQPRLGGCDLETVVTWLGILGQQEVAAIMLTGLNPSRPGMGVVKVGQRLMVTALLSFIYARLGYEMERPQRRPLTKKALT